MCRLLCICLYFLPRFRPENAGPFGRYIFLKINASRRNRTCASLLFSEAEPVFAEHLVGDVLHGQVIQLAEGVDGVMDAELRVVAQGSGHIAPVSELEGVHQMRGHGFLADRIEVVAPDGIDDDVGVRALLARVELVGVPVVAHTVAAEYGDADAVI